MNHFILDIYILYLASTATTTTTTSTTATTSTTPTFCATICTGNYTTYANTTTCGHTCVDAGAYQCQSASTYCSGGIFTPGGYCNSASCPAGYCCVHDTYASNPSPYLCMICNSGR